METLSILLALYELNPPNIGGFFHKRPVMRAFDDVSAVNPNTVRNKQ